MPPAALIICVHVRIVIFRRDVGWGGRDCVRNSKGSEQCCFLKGQSGAGTVQKILFAPRKQHPLSN